MINQEFEKRCMAFMKELKKKPFYSQFEKLGPDLVNSPEYKQLCPHPMDYATVIMNLSSHNYHNYRDWVKDMYLIYDNAIKFNEGKIIYMCKISYVCKIDNHRYIFIYQVFFMENLAIPGTEIDVGALDQCVKNLQGSLEDISREEANQNYNNVIK